MERSRGFCAFAHPFAVFLFIPVCRVNDEQSPSCDLLYPLADLRRRHGYGEPPSPWYCLCSGINCPGLQRTSPEFTGCWYFSIVVFFFILSSVLMRRVFRDGPVTRHCISGTIAAYLLIGLTWTYIYLLTTLLIDGAFSFPPTTVALLEDPSLQSTLAYYSFVTLTTVGYGDTVPVHPVVRMFAILEALIGSSTRQRCLPGSFL
jgi:hypothetical protein